MAAPLDTSPAVSALAITPSDSLSLGNVTRGIFVGGAGNIKVVMAEGGNTVTFTGLLAGLIYPFKVTKVFSTDTTATNLVALW